MGMAVQIISIIVVVVVIGVLMAYLFLGYTLRDITDIDMTAEEAGEEED